MLPRLNRPSTVSIPRNNLSYKLPSDQQKVALRYSGTVNLPSVTSFAQEVFGVAAPGLRIPKYWNEYFGIYKNAYVEAVRFQFQITELNGRPLRVVVAESNTQDVTPTSFLELAETPRSVQKLVVSGGNHSVVQISRITKADAILGHTLEDDDDYWNTAISGPTASVQPVLVLGFEPVQLGATCNVSYQVTITYHLKYFTLNHL